MTEPDNLTFGDLLKLPEDEARRLLEPFLPRLLASLGHVAETKRPQVEAIQAKLRDLTPDEVDAFLRLRQQDRSQRRGTKGTPLARRLEIIQGWYVVRKLGVKQLDYCYAIGISTRTLQRWMRSAS